MSENSTDDIKKMTAEEKMEAVVYQFIKLYDRWYEDRLVVAKLDANAAKLVEKFAKQVEEFKMLGLNIKTSITSKMDSLFTDVGRQINKAVTEATIDKLDENLSELKRLAEVASDDLRFYKQEVVKGKVRSFWTTLAISIGVSIVIAVVIVKLLLPGNSYNLTNAQIVDMQNGQLLSNAWPKLSHSERDRINNLLKSAISKK